MDSNDRLTKRTEATTNFERDLETLILESFTHGAELTGKWEITLPIEAAPDWTIEISKTNAAESASYDPDYITD